MTADIPITFIFWILFFQGLYWIAENNYLSGLLVLALAISIGRASLSWIDMAFSTTSVVHRYAVGASGATAAHLPIKRNDRSRRH
ncbi:hypothetical protein PM082_000574 [Marasmius tenuissimus]|nr:hypothetical protein PM082_000574 [Marasmius tenuissimus]